MTTLPETYLQLRSLLTKEGRLTLHLASTPIGPIGEDEIVVRIEATPINPSDLGLLIGPIDISAPAATGAGAERTISAQATPGQVRALAARLDQDLPVGNEGAGTVVAAGASPPAQALLGKVVAMAGGAMYAQYRRIKAREVLEMPAGVAAAQAASPFVNPMTALSMVETMRREGHTALVHTAAASNLGQMLVKLCAAENVPLVNIVRSPAQAKILKDLGARYVLDSSDAGFVPGLVDALAETGATLAFDAVGGGKLASQILAAMEQAANRKADAYSRYGSSVYKQVYIYGGLDMAPTELTRAFGFSWGIGGLASDAISAEDRIGSDPCDAGAGRTRNHDDIRKRLHPNDIAFRSAGSRDPEGLCAPCDGREVFDRPYATALSVGLKHAGWGC